MGLLGCGVLSTVPSCCDKNTESLKLYNCCNPGAPGSLIVTDGSQPPGLLCGISEWARDCWQLQLMYSNDGLIKNVSDQLGLGVF